MDHDHESPEERHARAGGREARPVRRIVLWAALLLAVAGCRGAPLDIMRLGAPNRPFARLPYIQAVDTSSAILRWRAAASARDSFRYRASGGEGSGAAGEWRVLPVRREPVPGRDVAPAAGVPDSVLDRRVEIHGLSPGARVEYEVYADSLRLGPFGFRTAPSAASRDPVRVLAFGDSGWGSASQVRLAELMEEEDWDLAIHVGDIAYQLGTELDFTLRHFHVYQRLLTRVPFFPAPGNHDLQTEGGAPYDRAFDWPAEEPGARHYAHRWGSVLFLVLDTVRDTEAGRRLQRREGPQYEWLVRTLRASAADPTVRWTIVHMHKPPYSHAVGLSGHGSDFALRAALVPLFERHGVDLVLSGHDHHYERSRPLRRGEVVPQGCGPVYMVIGGGGASRYARSLAEARIMARQSRSYHYLDLTIRGDALTGVAVGPDGGVIDEFRLQPFEAGEPLPLCD